MRYYSTQKKEFLYYVTTRMDIENILGKENKQKPSYEKTNTKHLHEEYKIVNQIPRLTGWNGTYQGQGGRGIVAGMQCQSREMNTVW